MGEKPSFWTTMPGILTGLAALVTAVAGLLLALAQTGMLARGRSAPTDSTSAAVAADSARRAPGRVPDTVAPAVPGSRPATALASQPTTGASGTGSRRVSSSASTEVRGRDTARGRDEPAGARGTDLRDLQVVSSLPDEVRLTVAYTYAGDLGDGPIAIQALPFQPDGSPLPGLLSRFTLLKTGAVSGRAAVSVAADLGDAQYTTATMRLCMRGTDRKFRPHCQDFPLRRTWRRGERAVPAADAIHSMKGYDNSPSNLLIYVDYDYTGDRGLGGRSVSMTASVLESSGTPVPGTRLDDFGGRGEVRVGSGTARMRIVGSGSGAYVSTAVKVCFVSQQPREEFLCRTFPWKRTWQ